MKLGIIDGLLFGMGFTVGIVISQAIIPRLVYFTYWLINYYGLIDYLPEFLF